MIEVSGEVFGSHRRRFERHDVVWSQHLSRYIRYETRNIRMVDYRRGAFFERGRTLCPRRQADAFRDAPDALGHAESRFGIQRPVGANQFRRTWDYVVRRSRMKLSHGNDDGVIWIDFPAGDGLQRID